MLDQPIKFLNAFFLQKTASSTYISFAFKSLNGSSLRKHAPQCSPTQCSPWYPMPQCHKRRFKLLQHQQHNSGQRSLHTSPSFSEKKYNFVRSNFLKRSESCIAILCNGIKIGTPLLAWNICLLSAEGENLNVEWVLICVSSKWFKF